MNNHHKHGTINHRWLFGIVIMLIVIVLLPSFSFAIDITGFTQISLITGDVVYQDPAHPENFYLPNGEPAQIDPETGSVTNIERPKVTAPTICGGFSDFFFSPIICIGRSIGAWLAGLLVFVTAWILTVAGVLFNLVLDYTVVNFAKLVTVGVQNGINTVWTAFRDISNIVIIGMFVFPAISIILGLQQFGQKKTVAKVLIIAVLINFSLLFTKMIIDTSNFTAKQFYEAASASQVVPTISSTGQAAATGGLVQGQAKTSGVAGEFMRYAGGSGFADTVAETRKLADKLDEGLGAMLHGIFVAILFLGAAAVLFYGAFLLIVRGILMIFLMMTASLAFASYLLPSKLKTYGWTTWWSSLLKNAVFAPILMFFLWAVLLVAKNMRWPGGGFGGGSIGDLVANPTKPEDVTALFGYIVIIGLLFAAIKISSSFASGIAGFNWASIAPLIATSALGRLGGALGRGTIGVGASILSNRMMQGARILNAREDKTLGSRAMQGALYYGSKPIKGVAQRDFNAMKTSIGGLIASTANRALSAKNIKEMLGPTVGGGEGTLKNHQQRFIKKGDALNLTDADRGVLKAREDRDKEELDKARDEALKADTAESVPVVKPVVKPQEEPSEDVKHAREQVIKENPDIAKRINDSDERLKNMGNELVEATKENAKINAEALAKIGNEIAQKKEALSNVEGVLKIKPQDEMALKQKREVEASIERDKSREKQALNQETEKLKQVKKQLADEKANNDQIVTVIDKLAEAEKKFNKRPKYDTSRKTAPQIGAELHNKSLTGMLLNAIGDTSFTKEALLARQRQLKQQQRMTRIVEGLGKEIGKTITPPSTPPSRPSTPPPPQNPSP